MTTGCNRTSGSAFISEILVQLVDKRVDVHVIITEYFTRIYHLG